MSFPAPSSPDSAETVLERRLLARLKELHHPCKEDPGFNPIWRLGCELSIQVETKALSRDNLHKLCDHLLDRTLDNRARWMQTMLQPLADTDNLTCLRTMITKDAAGSDFDSFAAQWQHPAIGCVFTAHPTFLLSNREIIRLMSGLTGKPYIPAGDSQSAHITLTEEHKQVLAAIENARTAHGIICRLILEIAQEYFPEQWTHLRPLPFDLASWVGYDMDGRTDIGWSDCVRLRLMEKNRQIGWYLDDLSHMSRLSERPDIAAVLDKIRLELQAAQAHTQKAQTLFDAMQGRSDGLTAAANWLTNPGNGRMTSLKPIIARLRHLAAGHSDHICAPDLLLLASRMETFGLGIGRVHFRINATQLHNAVRRRLDAEKPVDMSSRSTLIRLNSLYESEKPLAVNFAALAMETTTAVRQFLTIAQFIKHIDSDNDIRLLIAECERPATVLAAIYLARLFGVDGHVDISPLFETPTALEGGERFLDVLFSQPAYRKAVTIRNRISIQTGFSDAGRFIGQIPAALSIERLQANMARLVDAHGLRNLECLIFNTHGESMGRGAHPCSFDDRLDHILSPWARMRFAERGLKLRHETSFQGGDGYLWFATPDLALAFFTHMLEHRQSLPERMEDAEKDSFYEAPAVTLDFFRRVMRFQESLMASGAYHRTLTAFGLALLKVTGSRKARRQSETGANERTDLSKIRAIPHNAVLQQLGYPANVVGGIGQATRKELEPFTEWRHNSPRFCSLMNLVVTSRTYASLRTMIAYGALFDGGYWATRPHGKGQRHLTDPCLYLADLLEHDDRYSAALELATRLRIDELLLHRLLGETDENQTILDSDQRLSLALLHAVRIALIQDLFLLAASIPRFSAHNDISREDIMEQVFELRIPEALISLREAYPDSVPGPEDYALSEPSDYPDETAANYTGINKNLIDPMEALYESLLSVSVAISNIFHAHG